MSRAERWLSAGLAVVLLCPLVVAALLRPSPWGYGTHQQLGLPPCTFVALFHCRCPSCGMTTAWSHLVRGEVWGAAKANAGGALAGLLALAAEPWLAVSALRGRWLGFRPNATAIAWTLLGVVAVTLVDWAVRLLAV